MDLTTRADREGKHAEYANRYDRSELKAANLKELTMQIDRGYRVCRALAPPRAVEGSNKLAARWAAAARQAAGAAVRRALRRRARGRRRCRTSS